MSAIPLEVTSRTPEQLFGWLETKLPKSVMMRLQSYIETAIKNSINVNDQLAGNLSKSLLLKDNDNWFYQTVLDPLIGKFMECFPSYSRCTIIFTENAPYCLEKFWVNFQKQHEFNPIHDHSGVFSFVVWIKIPTDWREQHALPISTASNTPCASDFEFHFSSMLGQLQNYSYHLDKQSEGSMVLFPAALQHTVYPFYNCDKERVSISGNIVFDNSENSMKRLNSSQKEMKYV